VGAYNRPEARELGQPTYEGTMCEKTQMSDEQFTHIPVMYRDEENYKTYVTIVLEGAMSDTQRDEPSFSQTRG
jgi:hypothetical protein